MKLREFWIDSEFNLYKEHEKPQIHDKNIHVREISPELDALYDDIERHLIAIAMGCNGAAKIANAALVAIRKLKGEK